MRLSLLFTMLICIQFTHAQNDTINYTQLNKNNYLLQYPSTWKLDSSKLMGTDIYIMSELEDKSDNFRDNINIIIQDLGEQNINYEEYKKISDEQIKALFNSVKPIKSTILTKNNSQYYLMSYEMSQGIYDLRITSICIIKNKKAYLITFTCEIKKFDKYSKISNDVLNSFKVN